MIEAYAVGTEIYLHDLISPALARIGESFIKIDGLVIGLQKSLKGMAVELPAFRDLSRSTGAFSRQLESADRHAASLATHVRALAAARAAGAAVPAMPGASVMPGMVAPGRGRRAAGGGGHGGNLHFGPGGVGFGGAGIGLGGAGVPLAIGAAGLYGAEQLWDAGKEYELAFMRFKSLNLGDKANAEADKFARGAHRFGVSGTELMKVLSESTGLFGNFAEAKQYAPQIAELAQANAYVFQGREGMELDEAGMMGLLKFIDRRGGFKDEKSFGGNMNLAERMVTGSGGRIKFSDLDAFSQRGGTAFRNLSDQGIERMSGLLMEQGGSAAGVALMSLYQNLVAGRTPKKTMGLLADLGLAQIGQQTTGTVGGKKSTSMVLKNLKGSELLQADPVEWIKDVLLPQLATKGITSEADVLKTVNDLISNRTASNQASIISTQMLQILRDANLVKGAQNADQVRDSFKGSAGGAEANFQAAWVDFKVTFSGMVLPQVTDLLKTGTEVMHSIGDFYSKHAEEIRLAGDIASRLGSVVNMPGRALSGLWEAGKGLFGTDPTPPRGGSAGVIKGDVHLDGKKVGTFIGDHQARMASRSMFATGPSFDMNAGVPPVDMGLR